MNYELTRTLTYLVSSIIQKGYVKQSKITRANIYLSLCVHVLTHVCAWFFSYSLKFLLRFLLLWPKAQFQRQPSSQLWFAPVLSVRAERRTWAWPQLILRAPRFPGRKLRSGEAGVPGPEASSFQILDVGVECPLLFVSSYLFLLKKDREAWLAAVHGSQRIGHNWVTEQQ